MAVELSPSFSTNNIASGSEATKSSAEQLATDFSSANILLHELQLGEQLNESVVDTRRADFSLMLAMLAEDVREQSQFLLPQACESIATDLTNIALRKQFNLPVQAPLALSNLDDVKQFNQAQTIVDNDLANIHLANAMMAKPLAFRDDKKHIEAHVLQNTSLFTQLKHRQITAADKSPSQPIDQAISQQLKFNAKAWLDGIQQAIVKAPLLN